MCFSVLKNQIVCLGFDGWSNVCNEPILYITITTKDVNVYLIDTIDISDLIQQNICQKH